jgi:hypothetical protein
MQRVKEIRQQLHDLVRMTHIEQDAQAKAAVLEKNSLEKGTDGKEEEGGKTGKTKV